MALVSVNMMQLAAKAAILCEIMRNDGHWAIQGHRFWYRSKAHM